MLLFLARVTTAQSPLSEDPIIKYANILPTPDIQSARVISKPKAKTKQVSRLHSTRAEKQISEEALRNLLEARHSPLAPFAGQILASPYWSTIIGICTIEQYGCTKAPNWNFWGIKSSGKCGASGKGFARYCTAEEGIQAISNLLARYESKSKDTLEELNGYYVQPASSNWLNTVIKAKDELERLGTNWIWAWPLLRY